MAMGVGDAGSRLSLCGAPFVDYKVRAVSYSSGGCVSIFCQTLFLSTELCQHVFSDCLWARTSHKSALSLLVSRERKGHRCGLILFDLNVLLIKAKLYVSTLNLSWNKPRNYSESLVFKCDGGAKHS